MNHNTGYADDYLSYHEYMPVPTKRADSRQYKSELLKVARESMIVLEEPDNPAIDALFEAIYRNYKRPEISGFTIDVSTPYKTSLQIFFQYGLPIISFAFSFLSMLLFIMISTTGFSVYLFPVALASIGFLMMGIVIVYSRKHGKNTPSISSE